MNATTNHVFVKGTNTLMQCIKCETFDMLGFKKVDHKHPHCVGCYKEVQKEKRTLSKCDCCGKKHGENECKGVNCGACNDHDYSPLTLLDGVMRCSFCVDDYNNYTCEVCGEYEYEEVGLSTGENGVEKRVCGRCDIGCCDYNGWGDKEEDREEFVDRRDSPNILPYKKCSMCSERKSCGCYQDDDWFCENCAEEEEEDCRTKPCSCGCGYLGGSCDKGLAIDNNEGTNCRDSTCDEAYKFYRGAEVMVLCDACGGDWYNGIFERDGWNRV
jgi:hypothetical protein